MSYNNKSTPFKVITGYILLVSVLLFSIVYIYGKMEALTGDDSAETLIKQRHRQMNHMVFCLYQSEIYAQSVSSGRVKELPRYRKALGEALETADSLRLLLNDSLQHLRLDTLSMLLLSKERNLYDVLAGTKELSGLHKSSIEQIRRQQDTLLQIKRVQRDTLVHQNTYTMPRKKRTVFKRIAEVFVPDKTDTMTVVNVTSELRSDTLYQDYNPADTLVSILSNIEVQLQEHREQAQRGLQKKNERLLANGLAISNKVNSVLQAIEQEEQKYIQQRQAEITAMRSQSAITLATIAAAAILLSCILLIFIGRDISRSNHYRAALEKAKEKAEHLLQAREKMMLTITHDIKAPAGTIIGYIDLLARLISDKRQRFYLDNMRNSTTHLLNLIKSLLDFYRLDSNRMEIEQVPFNPAQLFSEITTGFQPQATQKGLELQCYLEELTDKLFLLGDPLHIRQITENLLSNALKFTQKGSVSIHVSYKAGELIFMVIDTGQGISEEEQQRIFREFTRLSNAQGEEGFGLGLSITQKMVALLKGNIQVTSKVNKGTTFRVSLPMPVADTATTEALVKKMPDGFISTTKTNAKEMRLLVIDDDPLQIEMLATVLRKAHFDVTCCNQPDELFTFMEHESFNALLTDIQMPALNGFDLVKEIHVRFPAQAENMPIIALTAREDITAESLARHGFSGYIRKPFTGEELINTLVHILSPDIALDNSVNPMAENQPKAETGKAVNLATLTAFSEGDQEASLKIIQTFLHETEQSCKNLSQALQQHNLQIITGIAHRLLPLFTMIEAVHLLDSLKWIEKQRNTLPDEAPWERIDKEVNFLLIEIKKVIQNIRITYNS